MRAEVLIPAFPEGAVEGVVLRLTEPISFWGGVSPSDGRLSDPRGGAFGTSVAARVLCIAELRGSSSASSVLLELIHNGLSPAAILLDKPDAILAVAACAAREMGWRSPPILRLGRAEQSCLPNGAPAHVARDGALTLRGATD